MRHRDKLVLGAVIITFLAIIAVTVGSMKREHKNSDSSPVAKEEESLIKEKNFLGIIKEVDTENGTITITDVGSMTAAVYPFIGGSKFISRYGQEISPREISLGEIVEVKYEAAANTIITCTVADQAWEYTNVSNWKIEKEEKRITVGSKSFAYGSLFQVFNSSKMIDSNALHKKDKITIKGIGGQAYSVLITKGHGTVQLANYAEFIGGTIEIGYDIMTKVAEDQVFTLREGDYRVTVKNGAVEAVRYIHINADELTTIDLIDSKASLKEVGEVAFTMNPNGATLFINNVETDASTEVALEYGTYTIKVSCHGYETYTEQIKVENKTEEIQIHLVSSSLSKVTPSSSATPVVTVTPSATPSPEATVVPSASPSASPSSEN